MVLKLRLARFGKRHSPIYNIVLTQARTAPSSKPLEVLGTYDPTPRIPLASEFAPTNSLDAEAEERIRKHKNIQLDPSRIKYWLGVGAQPSESVGRLLTMVGLMTEGKDKSGKGDVKESATTSS